MSNNRKQWLLKVIAGPHQGAEIGLSPGKTLIGSDDECDVVLHDILVAPQHVELELNESGVVAAPLGGRVFTNGKRIRDARQSVPAFGFISLGGTHLVLGPADAAWPLLSAADIPELEKETEPAAEAEKKDSSAAAVAAVPADAGVRPVVAGPTTIVSTGPAPSRLGPILGIAAGLMLLLAWGVLYNNFKSSRPGEDADLKPIDRARAVVEEMGVAGSIKIEEAGGGRLSATGYVDTETKQRELQAMFRETVPGLRTKIYSLEKIASSARSLVDSQRLPLTITSLSEGKLKVTGKLASADPWVQMRQTLLREVPGVSAIEDSVEIEAPRPNLPNTVYVPIPTLMQSGSTPSPAQPASAPAYVVPSTPEASVAAVTSAPVPQPDPNTDFLITPDTIDTPEATVATISASTGGLAFVRLSTGGVYFVGARLPYGGTVSQIEAETVTVIEKGVPRTLRQGDAAMQSKITTSTAP